MKRERRDFLVEIGTEELPPRSLHLLQQALVAALTAGLDKEQLTHGAIEGFATPRRLAVRVKRLAAEQPEQHVRRRGPPVSAAFDAAGEPTRAAHAFAESCGCGVKELQRLDEGKGAFLYFIGTRRGESTVELLPGIVQAALDALPIPRRMHWSAGTALFVRPVHWVLMLYGTEVVPATLLDTPTGHVSHGHRFHAPKPLRIANPAAYERVLRQRGHVLADFEVRRERIRAQVAALAASLNGRALIREELLEEVTALTEWPVALSGSFAERFLELPREVLISTLEEHQRCFPIEDQKGGLLPAFITVSNIESRDPDKVREGNERVVRPRLADATFFWAQDRKQPLAARAAALDTVTFQAKLGSVGDKARRVRALAAGIGAAIGGSARDCERAAELCKCDLLSAMVGEFPELQGVMGAYYAAADGESPEVVAAIREHYLPRAAGDELPATRTGIALAIADKLDTVAGIFAIGEKPTGTKDPFGLRRAALGIQRILIEKGLDLDLKRCIEQALAAVHSDLDRVRGHGGTAAAAPASGAGAPAPVHPIRAAIAASTAADIYEFLMERLRAYYLERSGAAAGTGGVTTEMFDAVLATRPASPLDFDTRLKALSEFLRLPESAALTAGNKRIANILRKAGMTPPAAVDATLLRESAERQLFEAMRALHDAVAAATAQHEYAGALGRLAELRPAIDAFFDEVLVMDEDAALRANRLALLAQLRALFAGVADLSRLPG